MKYISFSLFIVLILVALLLSPELLNARSSPPGFPNNPDQVPIDGGLGLLLAAGGTYGLNKLRKRRDEGLN